MEWSSLPDLSVGHHGEEDSGVTRAVELRHGHEFVQDCTMVVTCSQKQVGGKAKALLKEWRPRVLCSVSLAGPLPRFKSSTCWIPSIRKKVSKPKKLVGFGVELMYYQVDVLGGEVLQEWLRWNKAWKFRVIQQFWDHCAKKERSYAARIDGASCKEGLTSWRQRWRWCKPTTSPTPSGFMRDKFWNDELYGNTTAATTGSRSSLPQDDH